MAESMDIVNLVENDDRFGPQHLILPATDRTDIKEWQKSVRDLLRNLQRPRYVATGLLPEFQQLLSTGYLPRGFLNTSPGVGHLNKYGNEVVGRLLAKAIEQVLK